MTSPENQIFIIKNFISVKASKFKLDPTETALLAIRSLKWIETDSVGI